MAMPTISRQGRRRLQRLITIAEDASASPDKRARAIRELLAISERLAPGPLISRDPDGETVYADGGDGISPPVELGMTEGAATMLKAWQADETEH